MVDGVGVEETLTVVPTDPAVDEAGATTTGVVVLAYTGALVGTAQVLQYTTLEVVTGLTRVQGHAAVKVW